VRITEHRMVELASASLATSRERVARSGEQLSSGERVSRPSDDPAAWAAARRADAAHTMNEGRGEAMARSQERLAEVDAALAQIGSALARARELAVAAANDTADDEALAAMAAELRGLRQTALVAANTRASDGEYILAGNRTQVAPFDENGVYQGDDGMRTIETRHGGIELEVSVSGSVLTASAGVDIFAELDDFADALDSNDRDGINAAIESMREAHLQVSAARADGGARSAALLTAEEDQRRLEDSLVALHDRLIGADPIAAASELAQHSHSLEAAQAVAQKILELTRP
jgi:flagellar hook-associated protein 3 FlgL